MAQIFAARCYAYKHGLCRRAVSVCLVSVTFVCCIETDEGIAIVTIECEYETLSKLSNGTFFNDLERPLTHNSRSRNIRR